MTSEFLSMPAFLLFLAFLLLALGAWFFLRAGRLRQATGLPAGEIVYVDTGDWRRNDRPLFSAKRQLTGKPDYLVENRQETIPVEFKSTHLRGDDPYDSHKLQLATYCLLVEETTGKRPSHGILQYANVTLRLPYTDSLRAELLQTLEQIRKAHSARTIPRSHDDPARCRHCGYLQDCGDSIE